MSVFKNPIAEEIWDMKYRLKEFDGTPVDQTVQDTWLRVAKSLALAEKDYHTVNEDDGFIEYDNRAHWEEEFYRALESFKFVPAGRINAGAGTDRNVTLFNCFVMGTIPDDLGGIFDMLREACLTMQQGGGIGYDFSTIRPSGAEVKGVASEASGPLTFMDVWDAACRTIMSAGVRRGAMMATMRCDHPDIEKFIDAKRDSARLRMFNMSVLVTDEFMRAVKNNDQFELRFNGKVYKTVSARSLWDKITLSTYAYAEPGVIFIDRINQTNNLNYCETIAATNPCLHPDTLIETVEGRVRIADIKQPVKVYTSLSDGSLGVAQATSSWISKKNAKVWKIKTRNGKEIKVTPDHKVLTHEHGWIEAQNLTLGDRIVQLCRARRGAEYSGVKLTTEGNRAYRMEHRMIAESVYGPLGSNVVHHINNDTYDNHIDNFEVMTAEEHNKLTASTTHPQNHQVHSEINGRFTATGKSSKRITPMPEELKSNMKNNFSNAVIEIIEDFEVSDVYDLTVEGTHNMIGNFMVVHNCGEQPLPPYGACLLGSVNLVALLNNDYTLNKEQLEKTVAVAVRMMDNVVDVSKFPLPAQREEAYAKRRIGLGVTGLADVLALQGITYGSPEAVSWTDSTMRLIANCAYKASALLAKEKGAFPLYDAEKYQAGVNFQNLDWDVQELIREHGIRNALLTSIAPTGTISLYAGNVSSGIEPIFALEYDRKVMQKDGSKVTQTVNDYAVLKWKRENPGMPLPASFVTAQTLTPKDHVLMQAAAQKWVDSSISKTINCPEDITIDEFKDVYMLAWETGCKGCTTYRPNDVTGSVLSVKEETEVEVEDGACAIVFDEQTGQLIRSCE